MKGRILFKDYSTGKKSITITCLIITFLIVCASGIANIYALVTGRTTDSSIIWGCVGICAPFIALYWQKRVRASATGLSFGGGDEHSDRVDS